VIVKPDDISIVIDGRIIVTLQTIGHSPAVYCILPRTTAPLNLNLHRSGKGLDGSIQVTLAVTIGVRDAQVVMGVNVLRIETDSFLAILNGLVPSVERTEIRQASAPVRVWMGSNGDDSAVKSNRSITIPLLPYGLDPIQAVGPQNAAVRSRLPVGVLATK
jgi:hypothetical protein